MDSQTQIVLADAVWEDVLREKIDKNPMLYIAISGMI